MLIEMERFVLAHDRYLALDLAHAECSTPAQREFMHIQIHEAYLEVQYRALHIVGLQVRGRELLRRAKLRGRAAKRGLRIISHQL